MLATHLTPHNVTVIQFPHHSLTADVQPNDRFDDPQHIWHPETLPSSTQAAAEKHVCLRPSPLVSIRVPRTGEVRNGNLVQNDQTALRHGGGVRTHDSIGQWFALCVFRDDALDTAPAESLGTLVTTIRILSCAASQRMALTRSAHLQPVELQSKFFDMLPNQSLQSTRDAACLINIVSFKKPSSQDQNVISHEPLQDHT